MMRAQEFTLTDAPVIYRLKPNPAPSSASGSPSILKIKGVNFGKPQSSTSWVHIGNTYYGQGHPQIKLWRDDLIKVKLPKYNAPFPKKKQVWVTADYKDSNISRLKITAP
jgi:hypothetical protein